jgi:hypothetical protein
VLVHISGGLDVLSPPSPPGTADNEGKVHGSWDILMAISMMTLIYLLSASVTRPMNLDENQEMMMMMKQEEEVGRGAGIFFMGSPDGSLTRDKIG